MMISVKQTLLATTAALSLTFGAQAFAHAHLTTADPAPASTVTTSPNPIALHFTEGVNVAFTGIELIGPDQKPVKLAHAKLAPKDDKTLLVPVPSPLHAGTYQVNWHALATDGHKTQGQYRFTVK